MARVPTSSPRRIPAGFPLDDARGHAKRSAIRSANVLEEIPSPRAMVTRRHVGHFMGMARAMNTLARNERSSVKHELHMYRSLPVGILCCGPAAWSLTNLPSIRTRVWSTWTLRWRAERRKIAAGDEPA